jgi:hypothetical protein
MCILTSKQIFGILNKIDKKFKMMLQFMMITLMCQFMMEIKFD